MSVIARFEVIPVRDGSMSTTIASALRALDQFPVDYQTTATDTVIEAETVGTVLAAVQAAHRAIPDDRVITSLEIDEDRRRPQGMAQRVAAVERELGHPPQRFQALAQQRPRPAGTSHEQRDERARFTQSPPMG
ncbi:MAG: MTH1187 family thiamine-binding protein [Halorientalis sp.]